MTDNQRVLTLNGLRTLWAKITNTFLSINHKDSLSTYLVAGHGKAESRVEQQAPVTGVNEYHRYVMIDSDGYYKYKGYRNATTSANGLMSSADKSKLDGIAAGATKNIIDTALSTTSTNAVQNKAVTAALNGKAATSHNHDTAYLKLTGGTMAGNITMNGKAIVSDEDATQQAWHTDTVFFPMVTCHALGFNNSTGSTPQEFTPLLLKWLCGRYTLGTYGTRFIGTGHITTDCAYDIWISGNTKNSQNMPQYASFLAHGLGYFFRGYVNNYNFSITVM